MSVYGKGGKSIGHIKRGFEYDPNVGARKGGKKGRAKAKGKRNLKKG